LLIGWGQVARGRERQATETFNESAQYWARLQQDGRIESFDVVLLVPHGGDLNGFVLLRGSGEQLDAVRREDEFIQFVQRAALVVDSVCPIVASAGSGEDELDGLQGTCWRCGSMGQREILIAARKESSSTATSHSNRRRTPSRP
jgi:hypothetical protein